MQYGRKSGALFSVKICFFRDWKAVADFARTSIQTDTKQPSAVTSPSDALSTATDATVPTFAGWERTDGHCPSTPRHALTCLSCDVLKVLTRAAIFVSWALRPDNAAKLTPNSPCLVVVCLFSCSKYGQMTKTGGPLACLLRNYSPPAKRRVI